MLLVDLGEYGNSATYTLLSNPEGPFVKDYFCGAAEWYDVVQEVEVQWVEGGKEHATTLYLVPSNGYIEKLVLGYYYRRKRVQKKYDKPYVKSLGLEERFWGSLRRGRRSRILGGRLISSLGLLGRGNTL